MPSKQVVRQLRWAVESQRIMPVFMRQVKVFLNKQLLRVMDKLPLTNPSRKEDGSQEADVLLG